MSPRSFFPFRLFRWFLMQQILLLGVLFLFLTGVIWAWLGQQGMDSNSLQIGREVLLLSVFLGFVAMAIASIFMARRLLLPLGRLIEKTRLMRERPFDEESMTPEQDLTFDEPGEWFELERALNKLGRDLRHKTVGLSREKTELRAIMSAVSEAVLAISNERVVLFFNPQFASLFDFRATQSDVRLSEVLRSPEVLEAYTKALNGETQNHEIELLIGNERLPRFFQLSVAPLEKKHNREIYGAVGTFHDITELKRAERIRIEFVGNVSHELRTPLTSINGYLQTLTQDFANGRLDQAGEFLKITSLNVSRLKSLVEDLLDLSALESGKELAISPISVQELTEGVLTQLNVSEHKVHIHYDFNEMKADHKRLEQVLRNLLENAIRYVPQGRNIYINWKLGKANEKVLSVRDDGNGIAPQHQDRLFERFYRVDEGRSRATGGTGIGLSLVKHIVQRHGGQIHVFSEVGRGAEFVCEFPSNI